MDKSMSIAAQWDLIAEERFQTLKNREDISYEQILKPAIIERTRHQASASLLDVGCGLGFLTKELSFTAKNILGIDISSVSINLARTYNCNENVNYLVIDVAALKPAEQFDIVIANMVLMDMTNLNEAVSNIYSVLKPDGIFIFTITHPSFWPIYWDYANEDGFRYNYEKEILTDFKIRNKTYSDFKTSHFHRPVSLYLNLCRSTGFKFDEMEELFDENQQRWYPRFLLLKFSK